MDFTVFGHSKTKGIMEPVETISTDLTTMDFSGLEAENHGTDVTGDLPEVIIHAGEEFGKKAGDPDGSFFNHKMCIIDREADHAAGGKPGFGSGGILFTRMIVTAAHVMVDKHPGSNTPIIKTPNTEMYMAYPKRQPSGKLRQLTAKNVVIPTEYLNSHDDIPNGHYLNRAYDLAIIVTNEDTTPFGQPLGLMTDAFDNGQRHCWAFGYPRPYTGRYSGNQNPSYQYELAGYADRGANFAEFRNYCAINMAAENCQDISNRILMLNNDFTEGASGGPWVSHRSEGKWFCVGVNASKFYDPAKNQYGALSPNFSKWVWDLAAVAKSLRDSS